LTKLTPVPDEDPLDPRDQRDDARRAIGIPGNAQEVPHSDGWAHNPISRRGQVVWLRLTCPVPHPLTQLTPPQRIAVAEMMADECYMTFRRYIHDAVLKDAGSCNLLLSIQIRPDLPNPERADTNFGPAHSA
jgi:hypothetical protein